MTPNFEGIDRTLAELRTLQQSHEESYEEVRTLLISAVSELEACKAVIRMLSSELNKTRGRLAAHRAMRRSQEVQNQMYHIPSPPCSNATFPNIPEGGITHWYFGDRITATINYPATSGEDGAIIQDKFTQIPYANKDWGKAHYFGDFVRSKHEWGSW